MEPTPRQPVLDLYWYFASERQRIFEQRHDGSPGPWTDDSILQEYKFCNVYRAADRVSQYLIRDVAYGDADQPAEDVLFSIVAFRLFSRIETWESITHDLGEAPSITSLQDGRLLAALETAKRANGGLYTGAFILCANNAYGQPTKHENHVALLTDMFLTKRLSARLLDARSLQAIYSTLITFPLIGQFMAYQIAVDLNYSRHINFDENDFTQPGPGALRGIKKVFVDLGSLTPAEAVTWMVDRQRLEFDRLDLPFEGLWGRPLHAIDCQGLFCEVDKYSRVAMPELKSARKRIKARFRPNPRRIEPFFPPKWQINEKISETTALSSAGRSQAVDDGSSPSQHRLKLDAP